jgi:hypothetical protein
MTDAFFLKVQVECPIRTLLIPKITNKHWCFIQSRLKGESEWTKIQKIVDTIVETK